MILFFDTYALIEIILGNEKYKPYLNEQLITTKLNLMELYYFLLRKKDKTTANFYYDFYLPFCILISDEVIKESIGLKLQNKKLSYIDCIGYTIALQQNIKFLTGDEGFKNLPNVEFVK